MLIYFLYVCPQNTTIHILNLHSLYHLLIIYDVLSRVHQATGLVCPWYYLVCCYDIFDSPFISITCNSVPVMVVVTVWPYASLCPFTHTLMVCTQAVCRLSVWLLFIVYYCVYCNLLCTLRFIMLFTLFNSVYPVVTYTPLIIIVYNIYICIVLLT